MKTYTVEISGKFNVTLDVEAKNKEEAKDKARDIIYNETDLDLEINDTDVY